MLQLLHACTHTQMLPTGWKFVNRYANRSNKGIPMFAEERLKERAERQVAVNRCIVYVSMETSCIADEYVIVSLVLFYQKLQSVSMIEPAREQTLPDQVNTC